MLSVGRQEGHPACNELEWWDAGLVMCLDQGADLHIAQLMCHCHSLSLAPVNPDWFLVPAYPGRPGQNSRGP